MSTVSLRGDGGTFAMEGSEFPGDGSAIDAALSAFLSSIMPAEGGKLLMKLGTHGFADDFTVPYHVIANPGTIIKPAEGKTVTFTAGVDAGDYQWIDESDGGMVEFDTVRVNPRARWYGSDAAAVASACRAAGNQVEKIVNEYGMFPEVLLGPGKITVSESITITKPVVLRGEGRGATSIVGSMNAPILIFDVDKEADWSSSESMAPGLKGLTVVGSSSGSSQHGVDLRAGNTRAWIDLDDVGIQSCGGRGLTSGTGISLRINGNCTIYGNKLEGLYFGGDYNTDLRILPGAKIRRNMVGIDIAATDAYSVWIDGALIENNNQGTGAPGSSTRPCVGIRFSAANFKDGWIGNCYFEGHLNDVYGPNAVKMLVAYNNRHATQSKIETIVGYGTPERQFGSYYFPNGSNDSIHLVDCRISQPIKPETVSDGDWGTANTKTTTTGSIANGSDELTVASIQGILVGSQLTIAGVTGTFSVLSFTETFQASGEYLVTLDGTADATVEDATVTVLWGTAYEHVRLVGRSHEIRGCKDPDAATGRYGPVYSYPNFSAVMQSSFGGPGSVGEYRLTGATTMHFGAWNRIRLDANEILSDSLRAVLASKGVNVGSSGDYRLIGASTDSTATGTRTAMLAVDQCEAAGMRNVLAASDLSYVDEHNHVTMLSSRRVRSGGGSTVVMGWASEGEASSANRKIELQTSLGNVVITGSLSSSHTFADFAEYFENLTPGVIPLGTLVTLEGDKVRPWTSGDVLIGVVSATPIMVAGDTPFTWQGRYLTGEFGEPLYDWVDEEVHVPVLDENGEPMKDEEGEIVTKRETVTVQVYRENPDFDPAMPQIPRSDRPEEWTCVGLLGQVRARVGEGVSPGDVIGDRLTVMSITQPYDSDKGYAVARCLLR